MLKKLLVERGLMQSDYIFVLCYAEFIYEKYGILCPL